MSDQLRFDIFLAHNSQDKPQVRDIAEELKRRGLKPWLDEEQIKGGESIPGKVQKGLKKSLVAALFIGTSGFGKFQEFWELDALIMLCYQDNVPIIPILLPGVDTLPEELVFFRGRKYLQFHQSVDETEPLEELVQVIQLEELIRVIHATASPSPEPELDEVELRSKIRTYLQKYCNGMLVAQSNIASQALDKTQTEKIIRLHQASIAHRIARVIDHNLELIKDDPNAFNSRMFFDEIHAAILEGRALCTGFKSESLGDLNAYFAARFPDKELKCHVKSIIPQMLEVGDSLVGRRFLFRSVYNIQEKVFARVIQDLHGA